ncbi:MAG: flagella accessory protein C [Methanomassiliicoccus sp.]|nr:flagella accessory protein C [Methanomassiliicoccus sp.]
MSKYRTTLLASFFSSMAVLSFKKKGKDENLGSASSSLGNMSLNHGDTMSLGDLGGGLGTLSKLSDIGQPGGSLGDPMGDAMPKLGGDNKKLQEVEANVNDLKSHMESTDLTTKAMKGEMESIKSDLGQINDSIRTLLNVYEAVSKQYNPFVDDVPAAPAAKVTSEPKIEATMTIAGSPKTEPTPVKAESLVESLSDIPFDADGPLDRIVKPDEEEVLAINKAEEPAICHSLTDMQVNEKLAIEKEEEPAMVKSLEPTIDTTFNEPKPASISTPVPVTKPLSHEDVYALEQIRRLVDCLMGKICTERSVGNEIKEADIRALDLWLGEFKRLGGI